ncbi:ABC transporter substrate-binding protein [Bacillus sp. FJAT-50079]|uniref:ABC transporter substrate-binding protein n=1 Tax=Bacillus sp. FJAT-50079 TaxID=2833577 RepID=UPI001BC91D92|nr:ABC transporter substrate-binding protein [Bacillus sp. FJAT-50079]MBS4208073.1 ABC transporter substrate-binding protein [Bacillus sp. FJAT-50079]
MTMKKSALSIVSAAFILAACGSNSASPEPKPVDEDKQYTIGVTQLMEHPALNLAHEGFQKAIEESGLNVTYDVQNAQGDNSANDTIATNFVGANVDLIFANSTPSAQAALSKTTDIPIVFTSVVDPVGAGLVTSMEEPGGNVTGTSHHHPDSIAKTLAFMKDELGAKTIGTVYNTGEQNSRAQIDKIKKQMDELGLVLKEASASTTAEVKQATESIVDQVDVLYIVTDNTVVTAFESVVSVANDNKIPLIAADIDSLERGAFAAFGVDFFEVGHEAGEMAVKILTGESKPSEIAAQPPKNLKFVINKKIADTIGIEIKPEWNAELLD